MANYNSTYSGQEVDNAVGRALPDGTIDVDIRGKQDKLSQAQLNAVNSGINATKVAKYDGYEQDIEDKQDKLPDVQNDKYLHTNALTGELEWKTGISKGTDDYNDLINKPTINGEEIIGDVSLEDLNVQEQLTQEQLDAVNSEVTIEWKNTIDGDITSLEAGKQDKLTSQQISNINRALVSPIATSTEKRIVAVDEQNNQVQLRVGDGLSINGLTSPFTLEAQGGGGESKLVEVTYGVTTYDEITQLINEGKVPYVNYSNSIFTNVVLSNNTYYFFAFNGWSRNRGVYVTESNLWTVSSTSFEVNNNKENTISPTSTTNYPSSKAVADYVAQHSGGGWTLLWENASPSSSFSSQNISFVNVNYKFVAVTYLRDNTDFSARKYIETRIYELRGTSTNSTYEPTNCNIVAKVSDNAIEYSYRDARYTYSSQFTFGNAVKITLEDGVVSRETDNTSFIPYRIYGFN